MDANLAQFRKATAACDPAMEVAALATSDADNMKAAQRLNTAVSRSLMSCTSA
jgi:hypothetical protein